MQPPVSVKAAIIVIKKFRKNPEGLTESWILSRNSGESLLILALLTDFDLIIDTKIWTKFRESLNNR